MEKIIFLTCFVLEITREGEGNFYPPPPNHLTSIKKPNQNRVNSWEYNKRRENVHQHHKALSLGFIKPHNPVSLDTFLR